MSKTKKVLIIIIFILGLAILSYPFINNYINNQTQTKVINEYEKTLEEMDQEQIDSMKLAAEEYNNRLSGNGNKNTTTESSGKSYADLLNIGETIGYISIPKININLPIYHGTSETVLQKGVGHLETSSLPVGGESTHAVLTGHNGLPTAKLFTDLNQLEIGDSFYLEVLGDTLRYQIDQKIVVLPEDTDELQIIDGKDYVTLITCTPYMVNSHRLLVRGIRTENDLVVSDKSDLVIEEASSETIPLNPQGYNIESNTNQRVIIYLYLFVLFMSIFTIFSIIRHKKKKRNIVIISENKPSTQNIDDLLLDDIVEIESPTYNIDIDDCITNVICYTLYPTNVLQSIIKEDILESDTEEIVVEPIIGKDTSESNEEEILVEPIMKTSHADEEIIFSTFKEEDNISIKVDGPYLRKIENSKTRNHNTAIRKSHKKQKTTVNLDYKKIFIISSLITGTLIISEIIKGRRKK